MSVYRRAGTYQQASGPIPGRLLDIGLRSKL